MAAKARLVAPFCVVVMDDGAVFEVQCNNWDMLCGERHWRKHNLPMESTNLEFATFVAWNALKREAMIPASLSFVEFAGTDTEPGRAVSIESRQGRPQDPTQGDREEG